MNHHAVCYVDIDTARRELADYLTSTDPDVHVLEHMSFGIGEVRNLSERAHRLPIAAEQQVFVLLVGDLTHEAQNALLKLFEEPPERVQFYLVVSKRGQLLPTLQSRLHFVESSVGEQTFEADSFATLLQASLAERIELVGTLSKDKDIEAMEAIVAGAERWVSKQGNRELLQTIATVREHFGARGASRKMLLESLSLALPQ